MKMFNDKVTQVLNPATFQKGSFITLMVLDWDRVNGLEDRYPINGIITHCSENYFSIICSDENKKSIKIEQLFKGDGTDGPSAQYKVLGIASQAIEGKKGNE